MRKLLACALLVLPSAASADVFIVDYAEWKRVPKEYRMFYVAGVWDRGAHLLPFDAGPYYLADYVGINDCAKKTQITAEKLVTLVDTYYQHRVDARSQPPFIVLTKALLDQCAAYINDARAKRGLEPLKISR